MTPKLHSPSSSTGRKANTQKASSTATVGRTPFAMSMRSSSRACTLAAHITRMGMYHQRA